MTWVKCLLCSAGLLALTAIAPAGAQDSDCRADGPGNALSGEEVQSLYECFAGTLFEGYNSGDNAGAPDDYISGYRDWILASSFPAAPGFHGGRFLVTWVNDTGADAYLEYAEDPMIPAGTVIAKESFGIGDDGSPQPGPLFLMEKAAPGSSPETDDWFYMTVSPNGQTIAMDVVTACSACHQGSYSHQGGLGYPVDDARIAR